MPPLRLLGLCLIRVIYDVFVRELQCYNDYEHDSNQPPFKWNARVTAPLQPIGLKRVTDNCHPIPAIDGGLLPALFTINHYCSSRTRFMNQKRTHPFKFMKAVCMAISEIFAGVIGAALVVRRQ